MQGTLPAVRGNGVDPRTWPAAAAMTPTIEHHQLTGCDAVKLHVATCGEVGPLMLFLHGFPECWQAWHRLLPALGRDFRAAALDLRGYNLSDRPAGTESYGMSRVAGDVAAVVRALSPLQPAIVVGHDWGGIAAWYLARERPALVSHLVVLNAPHPALFGRELRRSPLQVFSSGYAAWFQWRGVAEWSLRAFGCALLRAMVFGTTCRSEAFPPELRRAYLESWRQPGALRAALAYYRAAENRRLLRVPAECWRIEPRTLVLWGERDPALRRGNLQGLDTVAPRLRVHRHPAATHWIAHEEPRWVEDRIREFVA